MPLLRSRSGPLVARVYHRALALIAAIAWASLAAQVQVLIGERGLTPVAPLLDRLRDSGEVSFWKFPTHLWLEASDGTLTGTCLIGIFLSLAAAAGLRPRALVLASGALYLSMAVAARSFLSFQWDSLLVEASLLAALLPRDRAAPLAHLLHRGLLFKIFFESAVAKAQSHLGDWWDGSAMTSYYETAPIPAWPAWYAHHLPAWWHHFESWWTLFFEGVLVFGVFGPRWARLAALAAFGGFLVLDSLTANYGFFTAITAALCLFLIDESDALAARAWLERRIRLREVEQAAEPGPIRQAAATGFAAAWFAVSALGALQQLAGIEVGAAAVEAAQRWRVANVYHLFGHITRERIEPEFQTWDGRTWAAQDLHYKPGAVDRAPPFVAPHQPRVDFRLWFYGLSYERGAPDYVRALVARLCQDPEAVQPLFEAPLPAEPEAVRIVYWRYHFTTAEERAETGAWWQREEVGRSEALACTSGER